MPATDVEQKLVEGLATVIDGLSGLQAVMGHAAPLLVAAQALAESPEVVALPIVTYQVIGHQTIGGAGDNRVITIDFACVAAGNGASALVRGMVEQLELGITQPALSAQNLDAIPLRPWRRPGNSDDPDATRNLRRAELTIDFWITK